MATPKDETARFLAEIRKRIGKKAVGRLRETTPKGEVSDVVPTGLDVLDHYVLGSGGYSCRRLTEVFGEEGVGKTSLLYAAFAAAQALGILTAMFETENRMNAQRPEDFGVDPDRLLLFQPYCLEELLVQLEGTIRSVPAQGYPALIGWDALASCPTEAEVKEGLVGKAAIARRAALLSRAIRTLSELAASHNVALVVLNQVRANIGTMFGSNFTQPGGHAMKFYASVRLSIMGGEAIKRGAYHIGKAPVITCVKNLFTPPWRKARCFLLYKGGWHSDRSTLELAKAFGILPKDAAMGKENVLEAQAVLDATAWDPLKVSEIMAARAEKGDAESGKVKTKKKTSKKKAARKQK